MPGHIVTTNMRDGYVRLIDTVLRSGTMVAPRGQPTIEASDVVLTLTDPARSMPYDVGRKLHMPIASAEFVQLVGGYSDVFQLQSITPTFEHFTNGGRLRGAYGPRLYDQWPRIVGKLTADSDTRQAVGVIWRPDELTVASRDVPCTISLSYTIRNGTLDARTHMRSNDLWLGTPYDVGVFTALQRTLAYVLSVNVGTYTHFVGSLHIYEKDIEAANGVSARDSAPERDLMPPITVGGRVRDFEKYDSVNRWMIVRDCARAIGLNRFSLLQSTSGIVHMKRLSYHQPERKICVHCHYAYQDDAPDYSLKCHECRITKHKYDT